MSTDDRTDDRTEARPTVLSDRALVAATRTGDERAWSALRARHDAPVAAVARARGMRGGVGPAFDALRDELTSDVPTADQASSTIRALRPRAIAALTGGTYGPVPGGRRDAAAVEEGGVVGDGGGAHGLDDGELAALAVAFGRLPDDWQAVLWHRWVEAATAVDLAVHLGRSPAEVVSLEAIAADGLFDAYTATLLAGDPAVPRPCRPILPMLGGHRRGTLTATDVRTVTEHLGAGCPTCERALAVGEVLQSVLPTAIVPGITGLDPGGYRSALGVAGPAMGVAAVAAVRSRRTRQAFRIGALAAILLALLAALSFIRGPLSDLRARFPGFGSDAAPATTQPAPTTSIPPPPDSTPPTEPARIQIVFPSGPRGAVYVPGGRPLQVAVGLSTPGPFYAGGTGTVVAALTNSDTETASIAFAVRASGGLAFEALTDGPGTCRPEADDGATCTLELAAGASAPLSMRFAVAATAPDLVEIEPGVADAETLGVAIEHVEGLVVGEVSDADLVLVAITGDTPALVPAVADLRRAVLAWTGPAGQAPDTVTMRVPGRGAPVSLPVADGRADVTDVVGAAGAGAYAIDASGDGSWVLTLVHGDTGQRRLLLVIAAGSIVTPDAGWSVLVPTLGSATPDDRRPAKVHVAAVDPAAPGGHAADLQLSIAGEPLVTGSGTVSAPAVTSYDHEIAATVDPLAVAVSSARGTAHLLAIGLVLGIAP